MRSAGILLAIVGVLMMIYTGYNYVTEEKVLDLGKLEVTKEKTHAVRWPPIVGGVLLIGGLAMIFMGRKKGD